MSDPGQYRALAEDGWRWVLAQVRALDADLPGADGPWLPTTVPAQAAGPPEDRDGLYSGIGGLAPVVAEFRLHRRLGDQERRLAAAVAARLAAHPTTEPSLADGLAGRVTALRLLTPGAEQPSLERLAHLATPDGWPSTLTGLEGVLVNDLLLGTAGVALAGVWAAGPTGDTLARLAGRMLLARAETTAHGLDWAWTSTRITRMPNYSHGCAGIAAALAVAGHALGEPRYVEAATAGARHLVSSGDLADDGFVLRREIPDSGYYTEPVTYGWCHGPTGTSYLFAALQCAGVEDVNGHAPADLRRRCLRSVMTSGLPDRLRPGFWDNDGRCCGTAGVGDAVLDAYQDTTDAGYAAQLLAFATRLGDALLERAVVDQDGARWRFVEHRKAEPLLPPGTGWMQGAAGIVAFLLRLARVTEQGHSARVVDRPEQWWAVPPSVRTSGSPPA